MAFSQEKSFVVNHLAKTKSVTSFNVILVDATETQSYQFTDGVRSNKTTVYLRGKESMSLKDH
jgi:hypothetical protein